MPSVKTNYKKWIKVMDRMLNDPTYDFAWEHIEQLRDHVSHNEEISADIIGTLQNLQQQAGDL